MQFNKTPIQDKELSIQIFKNGFSFCTSNARPFFKFEKISIDQGKNFQAILQSHSFLESKRIKAVHFDHRATFVPKSLYNPAQKRIYLNHNISFDKSWSIAEKKTQDDKVKILYPFDKERETTLQHYFKDISFTHYSQILYDLSVPKTNEGDSIAMNLHLQDEQFDLLLFKGRKLLLFNTYPCKNEDVFLYFVFAVAEELSLSPETFSIVFFGKYARYKKFYEALAPYHQKIIFADQSNYEMFDEQEHPAPYFINLFD